MCVCERERERERDRVRNKARGEEKRMKQTVTQEEIDKVYLVLFRRVVRKTSRIFNS